MTEIRRERLSFYLAWVLPALTAALVYSVWSVTRHQRFGSGAWDLGCHNQNIWLLAHFKGLTSSVLGDVNFLGGHFMPSLVLLAPLAWTGSSSILLYAQAALLAAAAWPLAFICRRRSIGPGATAGIVVAFLFGVGTQSTANFDFHEVAPLPLLLLTAIWAFEADRPIVAYAALVTAAGFKESAILYAGAVGFWVAATRRERRLEGLCIATVSLTWFLVVATWIQPALLGAGPRSMLPMARFPGFGRTFQEAGLRVVAHPWQTARLLVTPPVKLVTIMITAGGFAFLPLAGAEALILAVPTVLERFLSDHPEMWGTGFHYSLVLTATFAYAGAVGVSRLRAAAAALWPRVRASAAESWIAALLLAATVAASIAAYPIGVELATLEKPYFVSRDQAEINRRALSVIPADAAVVAQNHFLPHLAMREKVWLPEERFLARSDFVVLDPTQDAWPHERSHVARLVQLLHHDAAFRVVFHERATIVFARREERAVGR